jgi:hypothetical protein
VKQVRPLDGIGNVVALGIAVPAEIVGDLDVERAIRVGESLELDIEVLADDAARALPADDVAPLDGFVLAGRIGDAGGDLVGRLLERGEGGFQANRYSDAPWPSSALPRRS